ncbi:hypothetical protein K7X08_033014 [Anisodus acutangulus]|uniref:YchF C-terminal domain-containing protein n=1 Tax=Anisodus acutangulus TaxID=402998 RepID=A0A9Q1M0S6_9SOLA|nr:hypothetical protein K7X08_033014 [Anisodus acutangulus]
MICEHGGETIIPFSTSLERNLADMPLDEAAKYCEENKVKCWQIPRQTKAPRAAGTIHTDFERVYLLEVMKFEDLKELGNGAGVKVIIDIIMIHCTNLRMELYTS